MVWKIYSILLESILLLKGLMSRVIMVKVLIIIRASNAHSITEITNFIFLSFKGSISGLFFYLQTNLNPLLIGFILYIINSWDGSLLFRMVYGIKYLIIERLYLSTASCLIGMVHTINWLNCLMLMVGLSISHVFWESPLSKILPRSFEDLVSLIRNKLWVCFITVMFNHLFLKKNTT